MSDPIKIASQVPKALASFADGDLSLVEQAAVFRLAAEACQQAQIIQEITLSIARNRGGKA